MSADDPCAGSTAVCALQTAFKNKYGSSPTMISRAPGRVNLIGEHVDHQGYGVLPMAIQQACQVAIAAESSVQSTSGKANIQLANMEPALYPDLTFDVDPKQEVLPEQHGWGRYVLAAYKGAWDFVLQKGLPAPPLLGLRMLVDGNIPPGSGLSSSSALVCASALAMLRAWGVDATAAEVADFACRCERHVGTEGGGMDQAISMMASAGVAMHITFNPLRTSPVPLPQGSSFVIANCLAPSLKAESAVTRFNMRVVECRLAAMVLARACGATNWRTVRTLGQAAQYMQADGVDGQLAAVKLYLPQDAHAAHEVEQMLGGCSIHELLADSPRALEVLEAAKASTEAIAAATSGRVTPSCPSESRSAHGDKSSSGSSSTKSDGVPPSSMRCGSSQAHRPFKLRDRALHVYSEAARVLHFKDVCCGDMDNEQQLQQLGALMDASHASCSKLFECSCPELEELVAVAKGAGALGARLTGAGWGGCIVALLKDTDANAFIAQLRDGYYRKALAAGQLDDSRLAAAVFMTKPEHGASCIQC